MPPVPAGGQLDIQISLIWQAVEHLHQTDVEITTPDGVAGLLGEDAVSTTDRPWTEARVEDRSDERSFLLEHQPPARRWQPQGQGRVHELRPPTWNMGSDILIGIWGERTQWQQPGPYEPGLAEGLLEEMPPLPRPLSLDSALGILIGTTGPDDSGGDDIADLLDDTPIRATDTLAGEETE